MYIDKADRPAGDIPTGVRGTKRIDMTQWSVRPPSLMLGTMKVNPQVTVGFDVVLKH